MTESPAPNGDNSSAQSTETQAPTGQLSMMESPAPTGDNSSAQSTETQAPTGQLSMMESHTPTGESSSPRLVRIHILCPSLPSSNHFTVNNVPLSLTIAQLRSRITELLPSQPPPAAQRLIFRGRFLTNNHATIGDILRPHDAVEIFMHLVLPVDEPPVDETVQSLGSGSQGISNEPQPYRLSTPGESPLNPPRQGTYFGGGAGSDTAADFQRWAEAEQNGTPPFAPHMPSFDDIQTMIPTVHREIVRMECQLNANNLPSSEALFHLQTQARDIRDVLAHNFHRTTWDQWNAQSAFQVRILAIHRRVDYMMALANAQLHAQRNEPPPTSLPELYFIRSPDGYQGLMVPQDTTAASVAGQAAAPVNGANPAALGQGPAMVDNLVRRAVRNQQQRRNNADGLGRHLRRVWLFVRLYCLCFLLSQSGTWTRMLLVTGAALAALFSDTGVPRLLYGMVVEPALRHLEQLAHAGGPAGRAPQEQNNNQAGDHPTNGILAESWQFLRRLERALVLLFASLVPGVGERQVQARVAAEEAERARQVEQVEERQRELAEGQAQGE